MHNLWIRRKAAQANLFIGMVCASLLLDKLKVNFLCQDDCCSVFARYDQLHGMTFDSRVKTHRMH